jgi:acetylornithine deacetylase
VGGHKGKAGALATVIGREGHSSLTHRCVNAVVAAARLVDFIASLGERHAREGPFSDGFEPAYTTASVGRIDGGTQLNIVPRLCTVEFEFRALPGVDPRDSVREVETFAAERLLPAMRAAAPESEIRFEELLAYPAFEARPEAEVTALCAALTGTDRPLKVPFGTEAGCYAARGIPSVVCGPGDITAAHRPDEWIAIDQLAACDRFLDDLVTRACR